MLLGDLVHDGQQGRVADVLVVGVHGGLELVQMGGADLLQQIIVQLHGGELDLRLADLGHDAVDEGQHLLDLGMAGLDGFHHGGFVHLVGAGFDHDDLVHAGGQGQGQVADLALGLGGVQYDLAVHQTHGHAGDGALPGDVGHGDGQGGTVHAGNLSGVVRVQAHDGHGHADVIAHLLGEKGTDGTVHHTAGQDGVLAGAAFAAHEAAGDAAGGIQLLFKLHAQGEEVDAVPGLFAHGDVAQHAGLAVADHCAAVGQAAELAGLDHERAPRKGGLKLAVVGEGLFAGRKFQCHSVFSFMDIFPRRLCFEQ